VIAILLEMQNGNLMVSKYTPSPCSSCTALLTLNSPSLRSERGCLLDGCHAGSAAGQRSSGSPGVVAHAPALTNARRCDQAKVVQNAWFLDMNAIPHNTAPSAASVRNNRRLSSRGDGLGGSSRAGCPLLQLLRRRHLLPDFIPVQSSADLRELRRYKRRVALRQQETCAAGTKRTRGRAAAGCRHGSPR
jgi:hypothetical protein